MNSNGAAEQDVIEPGAFQLVVLHAFGLRPAWREVFLLCDVQGFTIAEAATILGLSEASVTNRLNQARREMHRQVMNQIGR